MNVSRLQIIRTDGGEELVVLTRQDYDVLAARAGEEPAEDALTARVVDETSRAIDSGDDIALPEEVWAAIEGGEAPAGVLRRYRRLSVAEVGVRAGIPEEVLAEIEGGREATADERRRLARALAVPATLFDP
jgi:hypothetical protein